MMETLPPVAQNVLHECKKCAQERYHKVLTHLDTQRAKIECEVCHSKKTLSLKKKAAKGPAKAAGKGRKVRSKALKTDENQKRFVELSERLNSTSAVPYKMASEYSVDTKIEHPTFGTGFVVTARPSQIEVVFQDTLRNLVQNRK